MVDAGEWDWLRQHATGGFDHLLIGTSLPLIVAPGIHHLETWNEAVCAGAWGRAAARGGEWIRQAVDLEHWSAFQKSFDEFIELLRTVSVGERGPTPASVVVLSGDVHHTYLAEVDLPTPNSGSPVYQATCSPFRNSLPRRVRRVFRAGWSEKGALAARLLARLAGVANTNAEWRLVHSEPWFDNHVATLVLKGRENTLSIEKAIYKDVPDSGTPTLQKIFEYRLS